MKTGPTKSPDRCLICGCVLTRGKGYALPDSKGRAHATKHHFIAERFFGRSKNRPGTKRKPILDACPWGHEEETGLFCYECHEELLHNPVLLPEDVQRFAEIVRLRKLDEDQKAETREKLAGRIRLLHEVLRRGIREVLKE